MTYISQVVADGAVGFYELADSNTTAIDQTSHSNGVWAGTGYTQSAEASIPGAGGGLKAPSFSGANFSINIPAVSANEVGDTFTIECWVKITTTGTSYTLWSSSTSGGPQLALDTSNPPKMLSQKTATSTLATSTSGVPVDGNWHHLVWTKSSATNHQYIDGVDVTGTVTNATISTETTGYGIAYNRHNSAAGDLNGQECMVAIYPTALSSAVVSNHYSLGSTQNAPTNDTPPSISGMAKVGQLLTLTNGTWTDDGSGTITHQWQRDNSGGGVYSNISGATGSTYTVQDGDYLCNILAVETDTESGGANTSANSNVIGVVTLQQRIGLKILS